MGNKEKYYQKLILSLLFLKLSVICVYADIYTKDIADDPTWQITGQVTDENGDPLPAVSVLLKESQTGVTTDINGYFTLNVPPTKGVLVFSFIGFTTQEVAFTDSNPINIILEENVMTLDDIIVTAYATERKKDLTGAVSVVNVDKMNQLPSSNITSQLQGYASGVTVLGSGQPGNEPSVTIRGANTFGNNNPLYIVDGVPVSNISHLNPNDIKSLQVLKDAGAASIYGSRASNGVIVISTKQGSGKVSVEYDMYYGVQVPKGGNVWHTLSPMEMAELKFLALRNSGVANINDPYYGSGPNPVLPDYLVPVGAKEGDPSVNPSLYNVDPYYTDPAALSSFYRIVRANKTGTNWYDEIFNTAPITSHNIAMNGGGDIGNFLLSLNYFNQKGTMTSTKLERYSLRVNTTFNIGQRIRVGENLTSFITKRPYLTGDNPIDMAMRSQPIIPVHDIMGNYAGSYGHEIGPARNPVAILERSSNNKNNSAGISGNIFAEIDVFKHLVFRTNFGGMLNGSYLHYFVYPEYENSENPARNSYSESWSTSYNWTWTNTLNYKNTINEIHNINVLIGTEAYDAVSRLISASTQDYYSFDPNYVTLSTGAGGQTNSSFRSSESLYSLISRIDYHYNDKYLIGATLRRDGSSKFQTNRYGWFPAISGGWRISSESFMKNFEWLADMKIRAGWGVMGNQLNVDPMNSFSTFASDKLWSYYDITGSNTTIAEGFYKNRLGNPDARWEKHIQSNIGVDMTLFNGKIEITADYYQKKIDDLLFNPEMLGAAGSAAVPYVNIAAMKNTGIDLSITGNTNVTKDLKLGATLTFTTYNNKIVKVSDNKDYFDLNSQRFSSSIIRNQVGRPVSEFFGYEIIGFWNDQSEIDEANKKAREMTGNPGAVYQSDVKVGRFRYADVNGDGQITSDDRKPLGDPNPDFTYGLNLSLTYKNFDLNTFFYGSQGNDIWNNLRWWRDFYPAFQGAKSYTALYDSWTPENKNAKVAIQETSSSFSTNNVPNSYFVEDGSYLRLKNAQIGYTFPRELTQKINIQNARIYVQGVNLFTLTKYSGIDPEIAGSSVSFGVDSGTYPSQRQYLMGVNITF